MEVDFGVSKSVELVRVFEASFDVVLELLLLFMLFDLVRFMFFFFFFFCRFVVHVLLFWVSCHCWV